MLFDEEENYLLLFGKYSIKHNFNSTNLSDITKITSLLSISISLIILLLSLPCFQVKLIITAKVLPIWKNIIFSRALLIY